MNQKKIRRVAAELCQMIIGQVPTVRSDANVKATAHFRFALPKMGLLKNTADIDNLSNFLLDACNKTFYGDDGQVVSLVADKAFDGSYGGAGYTIVTIEAMDGAVQRRRILGTVRFLCMWLLFSLKFLPVCFGMNCRSYYTGPVL
jgi:Holliday junction resolvase RusA-like endonuclease